MPMAVRTKTELYHKMTRLSRLFIKNASSVSSKCYAFALKNLPKFTKTGVFFLSSAHPESLAWDGGMWYNK